MRLIVALLTTLIAVSSADDFEGKVIGIADGDTVTVLREREPVKVRLDGIDAPEKRQSFGTKSKDALAGLVFGKAVTVQSKGTDRYGRTLGVISVNGVNVNQQMVAGGWAWHYKQYSSDQTLSQLELRAKAAQSGLWADANSLPPWEFRSRQPIGSTSAESPSPSTSTGVGGYWLNTASSVRHNTQCQHYRNTSRGRACTASEGKACGICGG
jgi:micrococcal nuclease